LPVTPANDKSTAISQHSASDIGLLYDNDLLQQERTAQLIVLFINGCHLNTTTGHSFRRLGSGCIYDEITCLADMIALNYPAF